jgi:hypothetical protein
MNLSPLPIQKFFGNNGRPLAGGLLFTYEAGTSDKVATYTDASGSSQNTNPIVLDFRGECRIWLDPQQSYKFILSPPGDTDPPTRPIWTVDDITAGPLPFDNAADDTGSVNNIELSIPWISSPVAFTRVVFKAAHTNTGSTTLQINGGSSHDLLWQNEGQFSGGEIQENGIYQAIFDGAIWQLQGPTLQPPQIRTTAEIAAGVVPIRWSYPEGNGLRYGMTGDDSTDNTAQLGALRAVAAQGVACFIPPGTYRYTTSPNWNIPQLQLRGTRTTILKHTGSGRIFDIDGGADGGLGLTYGIRLYDITLQGNANSTYGLYSRGAVHSVFRNITVRDCTVAAFHIMHGVSNVYDNCVFSGNRYPMSVAPTYGFYLTENGTGYFTADCTFINPIAEAFTSAPFNGIGCYLAHASGNTFLGGTFEAVEVGLYIAAGCNHNAFDSTWFEANRTNDLIDNGKRNVFCNLQCGSSGTAQTQVILRGEGASFFGGFCVAINVDTGSVASTFCGVAVSSLGSGLFGSGTYRSIGVVTVDGGLNYVASLPDVLGSTGSFTGTLTGVTGTVTGTISYRVNGSLCTLQVPSSIVGTSNTTACTITGMPAGIRPTSDQLLGCWVVDNSVDKWGAITIGTGGTITLANGIPGTAFTNSGGKGIDRNTLTYALA